MIYRFDDYQIDAAKFELLRSGESVPIEPQVLGLLILLIEHKDRVPLPCGVQLLNRLNGLCREAERIGLLSAQSALRAALS